MVRAYLSANRLEEGVSLLAEILNRYPDDWESLIILGDLYLAAEEMEIAYHLYQQAEKIIPHNPEILRRLQLIQEESQPTSPRIESPLHPEALQRLLYRLTGQSIRLGDDLTQKAADLLQTVLHSRQPAQAVAENLDEIERLIPALIELNLKQARQEGKIELANALEGLRQNVESLNHTVQTPDPIDNQGTILLLAPENAPSQERAWVIKAALEAGGFQVTFNGVVSAESLEHTEAIVAINPYTSSSLMANLALCAGAKRPIVLDLTNNAEQLPLKHPYYPILGLGTLETARAYHASLWLADVITVTTENHALALEGYGRRVEIMPDGWTEQNPMWRKKSPPRSTINLGWVGFCSEVEDLLIIRRIILRVLREFPQTRLVLVDNPEAYALFGSLPPERLLYLPATSADDFPYQLGLIDILLIPHRNIPYNQSLSERLLIHAGVKGIPWVASPLPAFREWGAGGFTASSPEEWHTYLRQLIADADVRRQLGRAGNTQAALRESRHLATLWKALLKKLRFPLSSTEAVIPTSANLVIPGRA
ncbi:MAG: hypothetical protein ACPLUL_02390 [Thermanaerothrix sp.]|uniref:hypothetical protein n=1 Tax=Thermanaerothrix sp. TaxID=2972675 RepID=UPI003C7BEE13